MTLTALAQSRATQLARQIQQQGAPLSNDVLRQAAEELKLDVADLRSAVDAQLALLERSSAAADEAGQRSSALRASLGQGSFVGQGRADAATSPALQGFNLRVPGEGSPRAEAAPKATFLPRPEADYKENATWTAMTESWGQTYDLRMQGRAVDGNLLNELARSRKDTAELRGVAGELAESGLIDSRAFEQISTNSNFGGTKGSLEERTAFALAVADHGGKPALDAYWKVYSGHSWSGAAPEKDPGAPLEVLHDVLGVKEPFAEWREGLIEKGKGLVEATQKGELLTSEVAREVLTARLDASAPAGLSGLNAGALIAYDAALRLGAGEDEAVSLAKRVDAGELDSETLRMLSPAEAGGLVLLRARFGESAIIGRGDLRAAVELAGEVARGELTSGQIYGFFMRYGATDDGSRPFFDLEQAGRIIGAVNRGQVDPERLDTVLDPRTYFADGLMNDVWRRMFSGKWDRGGNKYTVSGVAPGSYVTAPFTQRLSADLVTKLAADDGKVSAFRDAFQKELEDALPSRWQMRKRRNEPGRWEVDVYAGAVEIAFTRAARAAGLV